MFQQDPASPALPWISPTSQAPLLTRPPGPPGPSPQAPPAILEESDMFADCSPAARATPESAKRSRGADEQSEGRMRKRVRVLNVDKEVSMEWSDESGVWREEVLGDPWVGGRSEEVLLAPVVGGRREEVREAPEVRREEREQPQTNYPRATIPLSLMENNKLFAYTKDVLNFVAPEGRGLGHLDLWDKQFPTSCLSDASRKLVIGQTRFCLADFLSWSAMDLPGRQFRNGPGKTAWKTKTAWIKLLRLLVEVVGEEYGVDPETHHPKESNQQNTSQR